jgi:hypothetical protein
LEEGGREGGREGGSEGGREAPHFTPSPAPSNMDQVVQFFTLDWEYGPQVALVAYIFAGCATIQAGPGKGLYWAHSLVLSVLLLFGGGILAPFLLGRPPVVFVNDLITPTVLVSWLLCQRVPAVVSAMVNLPGPRQVFMLLGETNRFLGVIGMVNLSSGMIAAGPYYPIPVWGPILLGTIAGCGGLFLPFDKGLDGLKEGAPYKLQSAFYGALIYNFASNDPHVMEFLSPLVGEYSKQEAAGIVVGVLAVASTLQTLLGDGFNIFMPFNFVLSVLLGTNGKAAVASKNGPSAVKVESKKTK